jgi:hypothetical protein
MVREEPWQMGQHPEDISRARCDQEQLTVLRPGLCNLGIYHSEDFPAVFGEANHLLLDFLPVLHVEDLDLVSRPSNRAFEQKLVDAQGVNIVEDSVGLDLLA